MESFDTTLMTIGALLLLGVIAYGVSRRVALPQVTILILLGALVGPGGLNVLPDQTKAWFPLVSTLALLFVGFLLGGRLSLDNLRAHGRAIMGVSIVHVIGVAAMVFAGLWLIGVPMEISLLLAGIGTAAAPAAIQSVTLEMGAQGPFTDTLLGVVAIDDAWGLILFSLLLVAVGAMGVSEEAPREVLVDGIWEVAGALLIGVLLGIPSALVVRHLRPGDPMQAEAIGIVLLSGGISLWLEVSFLLSVMMLGSMIANLTQNQHEPFEVVEHFEWPFLVIFFVLSGASMEIERLASLGWIGGAYILLRSSGMITGAWLGGWWGRMPPKERWWIGVAIQPQAGVALGMALIAGNTFPEFGADILTIIVGSTVIYEICGPVLTRMAINRVGEAGKSPALTPPSDR